MGHRLPQRHLNELALFNIDSRPAAVDLVAAYVESGEPTAELHEWLSGQLMAPELVADQIVVKDPHAFWFAQVWETVTAELDVDLRWLTALRHPAEVVGSRDIAYLSSQSDDLRLTKETSNVAGWVHAALLTERAGRVVAIRPLPRPARRPAYGARRRCGSSSSCDSTPTSSSHEHHAVDDFIEPSMRKSQLTWDDVATPEWLHDTAEEVVAAARRADRARPTTRTPWRASTHPRRLHGALRRGGGAHVRPHPGRVDARRREARDAQRGTVQQLRRDLAAARRSGAPQAPAVGGREAAAILRRAVVRRVTRR